MIPFKIYPKLITYSFEGGLLCHQDSKKIAPELKAEIIQKVKSGERVIDVAKQYGIYYKTIYVWMSHKVNQTNEQLEISKLKRHNDELLRMVGELTVALQRMKKNTR